MLYIEVGKNQVEYKVKDTYVVWVRGHLIGSVPEDTKLFLPQLFLRFLALIFKVKKT